MAKMPPWKTDDALEWTYERDEGDLVVFARTAAEALATIRLHGFTKLSPKRLKATGRTLSDELRRAQDRLRHKEEIK